MNCKQVQSLLGAYLDREMTGQETLAFRRHLDECSSCRTEADDLARLKSLLGALPDPEPAPDFEARLLQAVRAERAPVPVLAPRWRPVLSFGLIACASMALTFFFLSSTQPSSPVSKTDTRGADIESRVALDQALGLNSDPMAVPALSVEHAPR